ncbi:MAG: DUF262 domain-containing protein [Pseudomonadota bacterium]
MKLPDFQRSWVWDEDRIIGLIASVSRAFPVGALMTLQTGGHVRFEERPIQGAPEAAEIEPARCLLLDGQQRMTSLYQTCYRDHVVETVTAKKKRVRRWFYIAMAAALAPDVDRETADDNRLHRHGGRRRDQHRKRERRAHEPRCRRRRVRPPPVGWALREPVLARSISRAHHR